MKDTLFYGGFAIAASVVALVVGLNVGRATGRAECSRMEQVQAENDYWRKLHFSGKPTDEAMTTVYPPTYECRKDGLGRWVCGVAP